MYQIKLSFAEYCEIYQMNRIKMLNAHKTTKARQMGDFCLAPVNVNGILTANEHDYDRIKLFDGGVWSNIAEPNAGKCGEYEIHTRNISRLKIQLI